MIHWALYSFFFGLAEDTATIDGNDNCLALLFNAWFLDNGVLEQVGSQLFSVLYH